MIILINGDWNPTELMVGCFLKKTKSVEEVLAKHSTSLHQVCLFDGQN